jgi:hypothetical protein
MKLFSISFKKYFWYVSHFSKLLISTLINDNVSIYLWLYNLCEPWPLSQFLNLYTVGRTPGTGDQPVARPLPTHRTTQTQNKCKKTSMHGVGFEPMIPVFEWAKTVHALDRAATVIGTTSFYFPLNGTVAMLVMLTIRSQGRNHENELSSCRHLNIPPFIFVCSSVVNFSKNKQHVKMTHVYAPPPLNTHMLM